MSRSKDEIREEVLRRRRSLSQEEIRNASDAICKAMLKYISSFNDVKTVALYDLIDSEVNLSKLALALLTQDIRVVKPFIIGDESGHMEFCDWNEEFNPLKKFDAFVFDCVDPDEIDVIVCPVVAYDNNFNRLGYGGGFYDRYIKRMASDIKKIGVAFECQRVDCVPMGVNDVKLDLVVTEKLFFI